jgi:hypothetical protein
MIESAALATATSALGMIDLHRDFQAADHGNCYHFYSYLRSIGEGWRPKWLFNPP